MKLSHKKLYHHQVKRLFCKISFQIIKLLFSTLHEHQYQQINIRDLSLKLVIVQDSFICFHKGSSIFKERKQSSISSYVVFNFYWWKDENLGVFATLISVFKCKEQLDKLTLPVHSMWLCFDKVLPGYILKCHLILLHFIYLISFFFHSLFM